MKGIYLTQEGKQEIEAKIAELGGNSIGYTYSDGALNMLKEILFSAIILPVEENWTQAMLKEIDTKDMSELYPDGLIIKSKD